MNPPVLEARGIRKSFGSVHAIRHADFELREGEVHALMGDNGAGKSTLIKILSGTLIPDLGTISLGGEPVVMGTPQRAREYGIETVYQDLALADTLTAAKNICLGREVLRKGILGRLKVYDEKEMQRIADENLRQLGARLPAPSEPVGAFSGGQRQAVAIARAAVWARRLIIMDEPTAALGVVQTNAVLELIQRTRDEKKLPVVLISHNIRDVMKVADRITVLHLGRTVLTVDKKDATNDILVAAMTGDLDAEVR